MARDAWVSNGGQGPMWLTYTLVGPLTSVLIGVTDYGVLSYTGTVAAGEIVEIGNHEELLAKNGRYTELYHMQFKDVLDEK